MLNNCMPINSIPRRCVGSASVSVLGACVCSKGFPPILLLVVSHGWEHTSGGWATSSLGVPGTGRPVAHVASDAMHPGE